MPSILTLKEKGEKTVLIRGTDNEKARMAVMLSVLADGPKLPERWSSLRHEIKLSK
jgi:hypothetical protein